jgi:type IV pilus assembly protein PilC
MAAIYHYTARSSDGAFVAGSLEADDDETVVARLRSRSLFITSVEPSKSIPGALWAAFARTPANGKAKAAFFRSFAAMISAGVSLQAAIDVCVRQCMSARLREALRGIASDLEAGAPLSDAMGRRPLDFSALVVAMIRAGEVGGRLDEVLERIADLFERDRALKRRVGAALAYPAVVTAAAFALVLFLIANTVPAFSAMFAELHVSLPLSTRVLIAIGSALKAPQIWLVAILIPLAVGVAVRSGGRVGAVSRRVDAVILLIPLVGTIVGSQIIARFARTFGSLLRSGVSIVDALEATEGVIGHVAFRESIASVATSLRRGEKLTESLTACGAFDSFVLQLVRAGEESGKLDAMLLRIAEYHELDVDTAIAALGSTLEPALILFLGAIVGTIVASVLIPLYSVIGSIR